MRIECRKSLDSNRSPHAVRHRWLSTRILIRIFHLISIYPDARVTFRCTVANAVGSLPRSWSISLSRPGLGRPFPPAEACRDAPSTTATSERSHNSTPSGLKDQIRSDKSVPTTSAKAHCWASELFGQTPECFETS